MNMEIKGNESIYTKERKKLNDVREQLERIERIDSLFADGYEKIRESLAMADEPGRKKIREKIGKLLDAAKPITPPERKPVAKTIFPGGIAGEISDDGTLTLTPVELADSTRITQFASENGLATACEYDAAGKSLSINLIEKEPGAVFDSLTDAFSTPVNLSDILPPENGQPFTDLVWEKIREYLDEKPSCGLKQLVKDLDSDEATVRKSLYELAKAKRIGVYGKSQITIRPGQNYGG